MARNILDLAALIPETECVPGRCGGRPTFTDSRLEVAVIVGLIDLGETDDDILDGYPRMTRKLLWEVREILVNQI